MPPEEEITRFKSTYKKKPLKNYTDPEKYMLMLISIPELQARLICWKFKFEFQDNVNVFVKPVKTLNDSIRLVKESKNFAAILGYVLALGNYMNGCTAKGQADGFNLKCLSKLDMTKDRNNKVTLIHYICHLCYKSTPEVLQVVEEFKLVHEAKSVSLEQVEKELESMNNLLKRLYINIHLKRINAV